MSYQFITVIVTAANVQKAREWTLALSPQSDGFLTTPLYSANSTEPTHYISSGMVLSEFVGVLSDGNVLYAALQNVGVTVTQQECLALVVQSVVNTDKEPFLLLNELGLSLNIQ